MSNALHFRPVAVRYELEPTYNRPTIDAKLVKINRRLAKLGAPAATVTYGPRIEKVSKDEFGFERVDFFFEYVEVTGVEAKLAGYTSIASLDHTYVADEALVTKFPGHEGTEIPELFRTRGALCDHCGKVRNRNLTIVLLADNGTWVQVGTGCVLEFLGVDPATVLWLAGSQFDVRDDDGEGGPRERTSYSSAEFLAYAAEVTRIEGFVSTQVDFKESTRDTAWALVAKRMKTDEIRRRFYDLDGEKGKAKAALVTEWVDAQESGDFIRSAKLALRADHVGPKTIGILASLTHVYEKAMGKEIERKAATAASEWIGEVGQKKVAATGVVTTVQTFAAQFYGGSDSKLIALITDEGCKVSTIGSGATLWGVEPGDRVTMVGTVKELRDDERFGKETRLFRVKLDNHGAPVVSDDSVL